jgi:MFS transporter, DHA1 family, inner membrane transport protein
LSNINNSSSEKFILLTLAGVQFTHILDFMIMMPLGPELMRLFSISPTQFGFLVSSYTFVASISGMLAGYFADRYDRKKFLLINYIGFIAGTLFCALSKDYYQLIIGRMLAGLFGGILGGTIYSIVGDIVPVQRRGNAMGIIMSAFSIASVAGVPLGLYLAGRFSWNAPFFLVVIMAIIFAVSIMYLIPKINQHINSTTPGIKDYIATIINPNHLMSFLLIVFVIHGSFTIIPYISAYMVKNVGISFQDISYIYLVGGAFSIFSARIIGKMSDSFSTFKVFTTVSILAIPAVYSLTNHGPASIKTVLLTSVPFLMFMSGRTVPMMTIVTRASDQNRRGAFMSIFTSVRNLSTASASFLGGYILAELPSGQFLKYDQVGKIAVISILLSISVAYLLNQQIMKKEANETTT